MALRQLTGLLRTAALVRASPIGGNTARLYSSTAPESAYVSISLSLSRSRSRS